MENKTSVIVSLKYSPGLAKEILLHAENLSKNMHNITLVVSIEYKWLFKEYNALGKYNFIFTKTRSSKKSMIFDYYFLLLGSTKRLIREHNKRIILTNVIVYNPHPLNHKVIKLFKSKRRVIFLHEPYKEDKSSFGKLGRFYYNLVEYFQKKSIKLCNDIVFLSKHGEKEFKLKYRMVNNKNYHIGRLLLKDYTDDQLQDFSRSFISFVGTVNKSRSVSEFLDFYNHVKSSHNKLSKCKFIILTRSNIHSQLSDKYKLSDNFEVIVKSKISDQEIADILKRSICTFLTHKQATQSGNVPVAYKNGTPIICRDIEGLSQHVEHHRTGIVTDFEDKDYLMNEISNLKDNINNYTNFAFEKFTSEFSEKNWNKYYGFLIDAE